MNPMLEAELLSHLDHQLRSAQRLLGLVLAQGALEMSNTDVADAMVAMIESQRAFQLTSKAIQTQDQMWEIANGVKR